MEKLLDLLDNWIFGPMNLIDRAEHLISGTRHNDWGYKMAIPRADKEGEPNLRDAEHLLNRYGVAVYGRSYDAKNLYFHVKNRQASWAEYLLLHAGFELVSPTFDQRNPEYVAQHEPGWMPTAWADRK